jgi:hypothetical protein
MTNPNTPSAWSFDLRLVLETPARLFAPWLAAVLLVTWQGYPGVVCVTPMAWLLALSVGLRCAMYSSSPNRRQRTLEAAAAGGILGFLQGLLFIFIVPRMGPIADSERASAAGIGFGMLCLGVLAAAGLAALNAGLYEHRREAARGGS